MLKPVLMIGHKMNFTIAVWLIFLPLILLCIGCQPEQSVSELNLSIVPANEFAASCINVEGSVLGDIKPCSKVYLYETPSLNFSIVLTRIRIRQAIMQECVNATKEFKFICLYPGKYVFAIPTSSYNGSVGSPLPYEFDSENVSLNIAYQGGDSKYMVGAFSIIQPPFENNTDCENDPFLCLDKRDNPNMKRFFD